MKKLTASLAILFGYALAALVPDAYAQESKSAPPAVLLPEVVTSATRTPRDSFDLPVAIDSVDKSVIQEDRAQVKDGALDLLRVKLAREPSIRG